MDVRYVVGVGESMTIFNEDPSIIGRLVKWICPGGKSGMLVESLWIAFRTLAIVLVHTWGGWIICSTWSMEHGGNDDIVEVGDILLDQGSQ
jgi:hypothetical protein